MVVLADQQLGLALLTGRRQADEDDAHPEALSVHGRLAEVLVAADDDRGVDRAIGGQRDEVQDDQSVDALLATGVDAAQPELDPRKTSYRDLIRHRKSIDGAVVPIGAQNSQTLIITALLSN